MLKLRIPYITMDVKWPEFNQVAKVTCFSKIHHYHTTLWLYLKSLISYLNTELASQTHPF